MQETLNVASVRADISIIWQKIPHSHITVHKSYRLKGPLITCDVTSPPTSDPDSDSHVP